jgi:hypothetical protein
MDSESRNQWSVNTQDVSQHCTRSCVIHEGRPATYAEVVDGWCNDRGFCEWFASVLASSASGAFRWETPAVTKATVDRPFEFVLLDAPALNRPADRTAFAEHFRAGEAVVTFDNLRGDARLVVPCPMADDSAYGHLAAFVRRAPLEQRCDLLQAVGQAMQARVGKAPVWLSTAGMGVAWLHVRVDSQPKYYGYAPYRTTP